MASDKEEYTRRFEQLDSEFMELSNKIQGELSVKQHLLDKRRDYFIKSIHELSWEYAELNVTIQGNMRLKDAQYKEKEQHYVNLITDHFLTLDAKIRLSDPRMTNSKERYNLMLREGGMDETDVLNVLGDYTEAVGLLTKLNDLDVSVEFINVNDRDTYIAKAIAINERVNNIATDIFGTQIQAKVNPDVKEKSPHNFLGWANVGFENCYPRLVDLLAHEGGMGHQTHNDLSKGYINNYSLKQTTEGLAIFGSTTALNMIYPKQNPKDLGIPDLLLVSRRANDILGAALEKMYYCDNLPVEEIADRLDSEMLPKDVLLKSLINFEKSDPSRSAITLGSTPYYVGFEKIAKIGLELVNTINTSEKLDDKQKKYFLQAGMRLLYTGYRRPERIAEEIAFFLKRNQITNGGEVSTPVHNLNNF